MQVWHLDHPEHGQLELLIGFSYEFREKFPDWPLDPETTSAGNIKRGQLPAADTSLRRRLELMVKNPAVFLQLVVNGQRAGRPTMCGDKRIALDGSAIAQNRTKPHVKVDANFFDEVMDVQFREGSQVVEFVPPAGSRAARRRKDMEESSFKRALYPIATGLGKGGWALAVLVLGPLVSRLIDWLLGFFPDWDWNLPAMPQVHLPVLHLPDLPAPPQVHLPVPAWSLPDFEVPEWILFLAEYTKIWVPILVGIGIAIMAVRNHNKSEKEKRSWERESREHRQA